MPSKSRLRFAENCKDVQRLLDIHKDTAGNTPGRKFGVEVLNKSTVVLICAYWEAYNEDICDEALDHVVKHLDNPANLPAALRKATAKRLKSSENELAVWQLAGDGWKGELGTTLSAIKQQLTGKLNTPKSEQLRDLFANGLGISDVTASWARAYLPQARACEKLDDFVTLRGAIAHRGKAATSVTKDHGVNFLSLVKEFVERVDEHVNAHVKSVTSTALF